MSKEDSTEFHPLPKRQHVIEILAQSVYHFVSIITCKIQDAYLAQGYDDSGYIWQKDA